MQGQMSAPPGHSWGSVTWQQHLLTTSLSGPTRVGWSVWVVLGAEAGCRGWVL